MSNYIYEKNHLALEGAKWRDNSIALRRNCYYIS
jgi:hypothetical protein